MPDWLWMILFGTGIAIIIVGYALNLVRLFKGFYSAVGAGMMIFRFVGVLVPIVGVLIGFVSNPPRAAHRIGP
jgi:hypothetical protein